MIFVYSIGHMFVCSVGKTFGHLSDRAKKQMIDRVLILEHYTPNKVFVSTVGQRVSCHGSGWNRELAIPVSFGSFPSVLPTGNVRVAESWSVKVTQKCFFCVGSRTTESLLRDY